MDIVHKNSSVDVCRFFINQQRLFLQQTPCKHPSLPPPLPLAHVPCKTRQDDPPICFPAKTYPSLAGTLTLDHYPMIHVHFSSSIPSLSNAILQMVRRDYLMKGLHVRFDTFDQGDEETSGPDREKDKWVHDNQYDD